MQEIQRQEQHAQRHVLVYMRALVGADAHALVAAERGAMVGLGGFVQALAGVQDNLPERERAAAGKAHSRKQQRVVRERDACAQRQRAAAQHQADRGHRQGPQAAERECGVTECRMPVHAPIVARLNLGSVGSVP